MDKESKIIFVCTGNICRSPMAAELLRGALRKEGEGYEKIMIESAGLSAYPNQSATNHSVFALKELGMDISGHKSKMLTQDMLDKAFAVFVMTESHKNIIEMSFQRVPKNLYLMREWIDGDIEIPDPYGEDLSTYIECRDSMIEAMPSIINFLKKNYPIANFSKLTPKQ